MQQNPVFSLLSLIIGHMFTTLSKLISKVSPQFTFFFEKNDTRVLKSLEQLSTIKNLIRNNSYNCTAVSFKLFKDRTRIT